VTRGRARRTPSIVRELRAIRAAIVEASAEQKAHRDAIAKAMVDRVGVFLRAALDDATPRTVRLDPPVANDSAHPGGRPRAPSDIAHPGGRPRAPSDTRTAGPTTPPDGPANDANDANDDEPPPKSGPRRER
jgi:hypothetical protein